MRRSIGFFAAIAATFAIFSFTGAPQSSSMGPERVIDGDTIQVDGARLRLHGIDAPEKNQTCRNARGQRWGCGRAATERLRQKLAGHVLDCQILDHDRYGRAIARCRQGDTDINAWLVEEGLALAYRRYSQDYAPQEARAQAAGRGLWQGPFIEPWAWRQGTRLETGLEADTEATPDREATLPALLPAPDRPANPAPLRILDTAPQGKPDSGRSVSMGSPCCKICRQGKPCGDSCIARNRTCHKGPGCACGG